MSNAAPSLKVALNPNCALLSSQSVAANTRVDIATQGVCNIAVEATSIDLYVKVVATTAGTLKIWERDGTEPSIAAISYPPGTSSFFASPRAGAPTGEVDGISVKATTAITLTLIPAAFYQPPAE